MEREIDMARTKLGDDLEAVTETGRRAIERVMRHSRPFVIGLAVATGVALLASVIRLVRVSTSPVHRLRKAHDTRPSMGRQIVRSALTSVAGTIAGAAAKRAVSAIEGRQDGLEQPKQRPRRELAAPPRPPRRTAQQ